jgi:hypothetical protein
MMYIEFSLIIFLHTLKCLHVCSANMGYCIYLFVYLFMVVFETGSQYVAQAGLKLAILLSQPLEYRNYRHVPSYLKINFF